MAIEIWYPPSGLKNNGVLNVYNFDEFRETKQQSETKISKKEHVLNSVTVSAINFEN